MNTIKLALMLVFGLISAFSAIALSSTLGLAVAAQMVLIFAKLGGFIAWKWKAVFSPFFYIAFLVVTVGLSSNIVLLLGGEK